MKFMPVTDSMFLLIESREHPMHVGGLQLFRKPEGTGDDYVAQLYRDLIDKSEVRPLFRQRPAGPVNSLGQLAWTEDTELDLSYHVRRSALPTPGRVRELLEITSRWHGTLLDRHRPLWETHFIEGLNDGRFAIYTKIHHAMLDGVSALRHMQLSLTPDPDARDCEMWWSLKPPKRSKPPQQRSLLDRVRGIAGELAGLGPAMLKTVNEIRREQSITLPLQAPRTMFNVSVGGARRVAAQSWPIEAFRQIGKAAGCTINDVVLTVCAGALRDYLIEHRALPDQSLTAMVPVSLRASEGAERGGNAIGALLCRLGTDVADPAKRLEVVSHSMREGKRLFSELTPLQVLLLSAVNVAPLGLSPIPGIADHTKPPFNLVISNVPGPRQKMYFNGAQLDGIYPASICLDGQAVNITMTSYDDQIGFGIVGCRRSVPHLQRMLLHLDTALEELTAAVL
ncbi:WS/DGAT/MGAT family O-acyltransferase [Thermocrispum agreste]|uniref:WS/DGAT/MGAT family O-acyltransferase n=1 Tax=Thermocrispum agreste TaxID=37925 RepID=UPI0003F8C307|nr:wax ester/triacylglycerol synthase family O-acyltransferase [Thermocrispum agreste]